MAAVWVAQEGFVRRTLAQLGVRDADVDDVAQEVARGVARGLAGFDPGSTPAARALRSWLYRMCETLAAGYHRAMARRQRVEVLAEGDLLEVESLERGAEERIAGREAEAELLEMVAALAPERSAVLVACEMGGLSMEEVAAALGIPVNTAWNRHRLAREDLRREWRRRGLTGREGRCAVARGRPPSPR